MRGSFLIATVCLACIGGQLSRAATVTVTNTNENLSGSLRQAIQDANPGDTIVFQIPTTDSKFNPISGMFTITLTSASAADTASAFVISKDLIIDGGSKVVIARSTASGTPYFRLFSITSGTVTLRNLTVSNGYLLQSGGGILNSAHLSVRGCAVTNNYSDVGGGIENAASGTLEVIDSTFYGNASYQGGRAINNDGVARLLSSTVSANPENGLGNNTAVANSATMRVGNSIIGSNPRGFVSYADTSGSFISEGFNFIGDPGTSAASFGGPGSHDQVGTDASPADPKLYPIEVSVGSTPAFRPLASSPVIDQGNTMKDANGQPVNTDERGQPRPIRQPELTSAGDGSDIGAIELGLAQTGPNYTVTSIANHDDGACTNDDCTLREAVNAANASADTNTINFAPGVTGYIINTASPAGLALTNPVTINGPGPRVLTISGNTSSRIFNIASGTAVSISGLTLALGNTIKSGLSDNSGGAIENFGALTLDRCEVTDNSGGSGGGVANLGSLIVGNCTFANNQSTGNGGAIRSTSKLTVSDSTFYNNTSVNSGAISSFINSGGTATASVTNCTVTKNNVSDSNGAGGGLYNGANSTMTVSNTIVAFNTTKSFASTYDISGAFVSGGHNLIYQNFAGSGFSAGTNGDLIGSSYNYALDTLEDNGGPTHTVALLAGSAAIDHGNDAIAPPTDQRGFFRNGISDIGAFEFNGLTLGVTLSNISTRGVVGTGDNVMIGGLVIKGSAPKTILFRALGPTLTSFGVGGALSNPHLDLYQGQTLLASNDDWMSASNAAAISASGFAPPGPAEAAILVSLNPGNYTAIVSGTGGTAGVALVEAYDLDKEPSSQLSNISTRGFVHTGEQVLIAGLVVKGQQSQDVLVRGLGPTLATLGVPGTLSDPFLDVRDAHGTSLATNDNWKDTQSSAIQATGYAPPGDSEAAILISLPPGNYTAILSGVNNATGNALVEVYALP